MRFAEPKERLDCDGLFRDVYVLATSDRELSAVLYYIRPMISDGDILLGGEPAKLPRTYFAIMMESQEPTSTLGIPVGDGIVNCCFFDSSELELDFQPSDYQTEESWDSVSLFLQGLADAMQREVFVTAENPQDSVLIRCNPNKNGHNKSRDTMPFALGACF